MERQSLRDWVHRFNAEGVAGLEDRPRKGRPRRMHAGIEKAFYERVDTGPKADTDKLVRWRRVTYIWAKTGMPSCRTALSLSSKPWRIQKIHDILSSLTYVGWHVFNQVDSKTRKTKDEAEWVKVPVPAIIEQELFDKATKLRGVLTPMKSAPRRDNSPNLLTGLLRCGCCGATMVKITAKNNRYRYYKCSSRISQGNTICKSPNFPMEKLDNLVLEAFRDKIYTSDHIRAVIDAMRDHAKHHGGEDKLRIKKLEAEAKEIEQAENKLYEAIEKGILELDDKLKIRVRQHKARQETIASELATLYRQHQMPIQTLTPQKIEAISRVLNKRFSTSTPFSRAYLKATVREIVITDDLLKLTGENKTLAALIASNGIIDAAAGVPMFIPEWRAEGDETVYWEVRFRIT
jgi:site-specific DNA recombinase